MLDPVAFAVNRIEHLYQPFHRFVIVGSDAIPAGVQAVLSVRSNAHDHICVNEVILKFVISAAFTHTETRYLFPDITLIGAYI